VTQNRVTAAAQITGHANHAHGCGPPGRVTHPQEVRGPMRSRNHTVHNAAAYRRGDGARLVDGQSRSLIFMG
jgi:hypothetical protein